MSKCSSISSPSPLRIGVDAMVRNKAVQYGIEAMLYIAKALAGGRTEGIQAGEVAKAHGLPVAYAAKVMSQLARQRLLRSDRGPLGGFKLAVDAKNLTLLQIHEVLDGPLAWKDDVEQSNMSQDTKNTLVEIYSDAADAVIKVLNVKLSTLIQTKVGA